MATEDRARAVKSRHSAQLLQQPGVSGVGVEKDDRGNFFITLYLNTEDPALAARLPQELEGCPVKIVHTGAFRSQCYP